MAKLLRAGIRRYLHSIIFWLAFIATAAIACICATEAKKYGVEDIYAVIGFLINAILIVMSVGREYSDGGFRNKVINGHTKGNIFISELILGVGAVLLTVDVPTGQDVLGALDGEGVVLTAAGIVGLQQRDL